MQTAKLCSSYTSARKETKSNFMPNQLRHYYNDTNRRHAFWCKPDYTEFSILKIAFPILKTEFTILKIEFPIVIIEFTISQIEFPILIVAFSIMKIEFFIFKIEYQYIKLNFKDETGNSILKIEF